MPDTTVGVDIDSSRLLMSHHSIPHGASDAPYRPIGLAQSPATVDRYNRSC